MALGWRDEAHPINRWRTRRDPFEAWGEMRGFPDLKPLGVQAAGCLYIVGQPRDGCLGFCNQGPARAGVRE